MTSWAELWSTPLRGFTSFFLLNGQKIVLSRWVKLTLTSEGHFAVQDDWPYWNQHQEKGEYGKPFLFDFSETSERVRSHSLFFDDNITGEEEDIVKPCEIGGQTISTQALCGRIIFSVNTVEAILDDDYFIKRVGKSLEQSLKKPTWWDQVG